MCGPRPSSQGLACLTRGPGRVGGQELLEKVLLAGGGLCLGLSQHRLKPGQASLPVLVRSQAGGGPLGSASANDARKPPPLGGLSAACLSLLQWPPALGGRAREAPAPGLSLRCLLGACSVDALVSRPRLRLAERPCLQPRAPAHLCCRPERGTCTGPGSSEALCDTRVSVSCAVALRGLLLARDRVLGTWAAPGQGLPLPCALPRAAAAAAASCGRRAAADPEGAVAEGSQALHCPRWTALVPLELGQCSWCLDFLKTNICLSGPAQPSSLCRAGLGGWGWPRSPDLVGDSGVPCGRRCLFTLT